MSARGMAFSDYSWCRYVFADAPDNQYIYRIELLENLPTHPESIAYLRFLEENGVECVSSYMRWVYLRKNASEGPFDIYTDIDSKIRHYQRISIFWTTLMIVEFTAAFVNLAVGIIKPESSGTAGRLLLWKSGDRVMSARIRTGIPCVGRADPQKD